jgi:hypothetical protein
MSPGTAMSRIAHHKRTSIAVLHRRRISVHLARRLDTIESLCSLVHTGIPARGVTYFHGYPHHAHGSRSRVREI